MYNTVKSEEITRLLIECEGGELNYIKNNVKEMLNLMKSPVNLIESMSMIAGLKEKADSILELKLRQDKTNTYKIVCQDDSLLVFISTFLSLAHDKNTVISYLTMIDEYLSRGRNPSAKEFDLISEDKMVDILKLPIVEKFINFIPHGKELTILNLNYGFDVNSICFPVTRTIVNTRNNKLFARDTTREQIFMHEIGHAVQFLLTGHIDAYPEQFRNLSMNVDLFDDTPRLDKQEIFADFFTVACCWGNKYEKANFLMNFFSSGDAKEVFEYFNSVKSIDISKRAFRV